MKFVKSILPVFCAAMIFVSCHDKADITGSPAATEQSRIIEKALNIVSGTVDTIYTKKFEFSTLWIIVLTTSSGASVQLEFYGADRSLRWIIGLTPPYNYEVTPGNGLLTLSQATLIALQNRPGEITWWILRKDKRNVDWEYRYYIQDENKSWDVRLKAASGLVIRNN